MTTNRRKASLIETMEDHKLAVSVIATISELSLGLLGLKYAIIGTTTPLVGLTVDLLMSMPKDTATQIDRVINKAYERLAQMEKSIAEEEILSELLEKEKVLDIESLIKNTEYYKQLFNSNSDEKKIVDGLVTKFNVYLQEEIIHNDTVNKVFIMSAHLMTLDNLKKMVEISKEISKTTEKSLRVAEDTQKEVRATHYEVSKTNFLISAFSSKAIRLVCKIFLFILLCFIAKIITFDLDPASILSMTQFWEIVLIFVISAFLFSFVEISNRPSPKQFLLVALFEVICYFICDSVIFDQVLVTAGSNLSFNKTVHFLMVTFCIILSEMFLFFYDNFVNMSQKKAELREHSRSRIQNKKKSPRH